MRWLVAMRVSTMNVLTRWWGYPCNGHDGWFIDVGVLGCAATVGVVMRIGSYWSAGVCSRRCRRGGGLHGVDR